MKTIIKSAALISAVSLLAACGGDETTTTQSSPANYHDITTTMQGTIRNAVDGARITDESLKVTLVQGSNYRSANVRRGTADFAGDYSISAIPTSTDNNITYRMVSTADGFQDFEAAVNFDVDSDEDLQDRRVNVLSNIVMYPLGSFASDVKVHVMFKNEPVANATVLLDPRTGSNTVTTSTSNTLNADTGYQASKQVITDASGLATFAAAELVLGGQYNIRVLPTAFEGSQLALPTVSPFTVGTTQNIVNVNMTETVPGTDNGLFVASASNLDDDMVTSGGALTLTFSRAVSLVDETNITASLTNATTAALNATSSPDSTVIGALSADGLTLTLTPQFAAAAAPVPFTGTNGTTADNGLIVTYSNVFVRISDASDSAVIYDVLALIAADTGLVINATVQATADFN
jgi:hypothetical protein